MNGDDLGRITQRSETIGGVTTSYQYTYDLAGRIDQVFEGGLLVRDHDFDPNGNPLAATVDAQDRLLALGGFTYTYTDNGDLQSKTETASGDQWTYTYDALGNLLQATLPGGPGTTLTYVIDGSNRRIGKKRDGVLEPRPSPVPAPPLGRVPSRPEPLGGERYCIRFTVDPETWAQLEELRALMRHQVPDGDVGKILGRAIRTLLAQVRKQKLGECERPRSPEPSSPSPGRSHGSSPSRAIPRAIRREVFRRDGGRCTYASPDGRRCEARESIELHHGDPWARSRRHHADQITLRCRAHNQHQAERDFGACHMARFRNTRCGRPREHDLDHVPRPGADLP